MSKEYKTTYEWDRIVKSTNIPLKKTPYETNVYSNSTSKHSTTIDQSERKSANIAQLQ